MDMHSNRLSIDNSIFVGSFGSIGLKYEAENKEKNNLQIHISFVYILYISTKYWSIARFISIIFLWKSSTKILSMHI